MSRSGAHEALRDHRLDMLIDLTTRPQAVPPVRIICGGLGRFRITSAPVDMPECTIEPPLYAGDPMEADADDHDAWLDQTILDGDL